MSNKILKGTFWLTGAAFLSKFLGMIYVIPFNELVGYEGGSLYYFAYNPYTVLLGISTVGLPLAVSKIVSKYNSLGYYHTGIRVFKLSLLLMVISGFLSFLFLYFSADWLAVKFEYDGDSVDDVTGVIKMLSFALLIIPIMSVFRGFYQGNEFMQPTAISQVIEQIVRITFVLISVYIIMTWGSQDVPVAVGFATFAAFIGAIASFITLLYFWKKNKHALVSFNSKQTKYLNISNKDLMVELFSYAGPFILVGIAIPLYQLVDSFTFNKAMYLSGYNKEIVDTALSAIHMYGHKLISIPITIATGLSLTIVPSLTASFSSNDFFKLKREINQSLQIVLFLIIPAVVGLSALSHVAYGTLFGMEHLDLTGSLLTWYAPVALGFGMFTVTSAILQGINEQRFALVSLFVGFIIKLICNSLFIHQFGPKGSIIATGLATGVAVLLNLYRIKRAIHFSYLQTVKRTLFMFIFSMMMFVVVLLLKVIFGFIIPYETSRFAAAIMLGIGIVGGGITYIYLTIKSTLLDFVLGDLGIVRKIRRNKNAT